MDFASDIMRLHIIIAISFAVINSLLFIPWRKSIKTMCAVAGVVGVGLIILLSYSYFFTNFSVTIMMRIIDVFWLIAAFYYAKYRDFRTIFSILSVWLFLLTGTALATTLSLFADNILGKIVIMLIVHSIFPICISIYIRKTLFSIMHLGKQGWLVFCLVLIPPFILIRLISIHPIPLSFNPANIPLAITASITILVFYIVFAKSSEYLLYQRKNKQTLDLISSNIKQTEIKLNEAAKREEQNAILRHDLRHFARVIASCINNNLYDEALYSVQNLLSHPAMLDPEISYCKIPTINALLSSYASRAENEGIDFKASISLNDNHYIDTMDLSVLLSNTLENAMNSSNEQPETSPKEVNVKLYNAGKQVFISISNACDTLVDINQDTGLPSPNINSKGQGIGLLSVRSFIQKYNAHVDCSQNNKYFQMRIIATAPEHSEAELQKSRKAQSTILRINLMISSLIIAGFLLACLSSYISFNNLFKTDIESVSELTSQNIHANVSNLIDRPINISLAMSSDTLLKELLSREAKSGGSPLLTEKVKDYLSSYQKKYGFDSVTLTSTATGAYYHFEEGIARHMSPDNPEDIWYYELLNDPAECKMNIDADKVRDNNLTLFADTKIIGTDGTVLGIIGIGMRTPYIQELLMDNETQHNVRAFLIDQEGVIQISSDLTELSGVNLFDDPIFTSMKDSIILNKGTNEHKWYSDGHLDGYIITKYIPNLNWYLVVEKDTAEFQQTMISQLLTSLLFMALVVFIVLIITNKILSKYYNILLGSPQRDILTGLRNRSSYDQEIQVFSSKLATYVDFGICVFNINNFKQLNDTLGRQAGDAYLQNFAKILSEIFPHCPLFRIGGNEFSAIFIDMKEDEVLEKLELLAPALSVKNQNTPLDTSVSFGYAFRDFDKLTDVTKIFREADKRMHKQAQKAKSFIK